MPISALRETVRRELVGFAWDQWAQLGVFGHTERRDRATADPEALLLFTLEVGRDDPRLFDEVLDWLLTNQGLISVQRLRNLCIEGGFLGLTADTWPTHRDWPQILRTPSTESMDRRPATRRTHAVHARKPCT